MRTQSDAGFEAELEDGLAELGAQSPGDAPAPFLDGVLARRRAVRTRRAAFVAGIAVALLAVVAALPERPRPGVEEPRLVAEAVRADPEAGSLGVLRQAWESDTGSGTWMAALDAVDEGGAGERTLRMGDSVRMLAGGL